MPHYLDDTKFMHLALEQAQLAAHTGEIPVGAVLVKDNTVIAAEGNASIAANDPSAHAEIHTIRAAGAVLNNYRLLNTTLYVTLEPCAMCVGAIVHARIERLVFGAHDPKTGAVESAINLLDAGFHNHRVSWTGGVMAEESRVLLQSFFKTRREQAKKC